MCPTNSFVCGIQVSNTICMGALKMHAHLPCEAAQFTQNLLAHHNTT